MVQKYVLGDTYLDIIADLSLDDCESMLEGFRQAKDETMWAIADTLVYASDKYPETYEQILDHTNWSLQTVENYKTTSRKIPRAVRRKGVSFSNHSEVASLDPVNRDHALNQLESKLWSRADVRAFKRELKGDTSTEQTITLKWEQMQMHDGKLIVVFVAPMDEIIEFKAIVRKPAMDKAS